jgi:hypothetical protein
MLAGTSPAVRERHTSLPLPRRYAVAHRRAISQRTHSQLAGGSRVGPYPWEHDRWTRHEAPNCRWSSRCSTSRRCCRCSRSDCARCSTRPPSATRSSASTTAARDLTPALLHKLDREWAQVRVVRLRANAGHQAAISAGSRPRARRLRRHHRRRPAGPARGHRRDARHRPPRRVSTSSTGCAATARPTRCSSGRPPGPSTRSSAGSPARPRSRTRATSGSCRGPPSMRSTACPTPTGCCASSCRPWVSRRRVWPTAGRSARLATSKYPFLKMLKLSLDSVTGFSLFPLRLATYLGLVGGALMLLAAIVLVIASRTATARPSPVGPRPWSSSPVSVRSSCSASALLGEYVGRMYTQLQGRPAYFIASDSLIDSRVD